MVLLNILTKQAKKIKTLVSGSYQNYSFSDDESQILLLKEQQPIYRHSFLGKFEIKNLKTGKTISLNNGDWIQEPKFSPNGNFVAFIFNNNLYYQDLNTEKITQITHDGDRNRIINGLADWVYEEEFGHADMYQWAKNSEAIIFVRYGGYN